MAANTWQFRDFIDIHECGNLLKYIKQCADDKTEVDLLRIAIQLGKIFRIEGNLDDFAEKIRNKISKFLVENPGIDFVFHNADEVFSKVAQVIKDAIQKYYDGEIGKEELVGLIMTNGVGFAKISFEDNIKVAAEKIGFAKIGIEDSIQVSAEKIGIKAISGSVLTWSVISITLLTRAYLILKKSMQEYRLAREERIRVEKECEEAIKQIVEYRRELELCCEEYFRESYSVIESGLSAMDQALLEDDVDGFITGNVEIQKLLKYDTQFTTQEEFDQLMDIEDSFKL